MLYTLAVNEQSASLKAIMISLVAGLFIGAAKGRFILSKTARRNRVRIEKLEHPVRIHHIFAPPFYLFIVGMMALGFLLRSQNQLFGGYIVVAAIYCGIGAALIVSSLAYWKGENQSVES